MSLKTNTQLSKRAKLIIGALLMTIIFAVDLYTPLGIPDGMSYILIVLLTIWAENKKYTIAVAIISVALTIIGFYLSPITTGDIKDIAIVNRTISVVCIISAAVLIIKYKNVEEMMNSQRINLERMSDKLKETNAHLEEQVKQRTLVLEEALQNLETSKQDLSVALEHEKELNALKSRFVSMASHEFRTPLATILSSLSLIQKYVETNDSEKQTKHINRMKSAINHLTDLLEDTLSVSKLEEGKINFTAETILIDEFTSALVQEMQIIAKMGQVINYSHDGQAEIINDRKVLKRIMLNLVSNSLKFSKEHTEVNVLTKTKDKSFILIVKDEGMGISEQDQERLFERFFRAENAFNIQGTGLGLNIVAKYVELLNGTIAVESKLNEGSTFTVKLPLIAKVKSENAFVN